MNPRTWRTLLEAVVITSCLLLIIKQYPKPGISSRAITNTLNQELKRNTPLLLFQNPSPLTPIISTTDFDTDDSAAN